MAIRQLSPTQSVLAGSMPGGRGDPRRPPTGGEPWLFAPDGAGLWDLLRDTELT